MPDGAKVLLLQPPSPRINFTLPLGLGYLAAVFKAKGMAVEIVDATAPYSHYNIQETIREVVRRQPKFVGINVNTLFCGFAYDLLKELKRLGIFVFAGGPHASLFSEEVLEAGADIAVRGEGEATIAELAEYFLGQRQLNDILGISFRCADGRMAVNAGRPLLEDLDAIPFPAKEAFDIRAFARNDFELWRFGGVLTSRGCIGRCSFCCREIFANRYRTRSVGSVIEEIKFLKEHYGLKSFYFLDDIFTAGRKRTLVLCESLRRELWPNFEFSCITRFDRVDKELLSEMKKAGCRAINFGVESANPSTLLKLNKTETIEEMEEKIFLTNELGIDCSINFMWGYPWEGKGELENTVSLMKRLSSRVSEIMPGGILVPFPGTELYAQQKARYNLEGWWQRRESFTADYRLNCNVVLFRHYLFDDQGQLTGGGFFGIGRDLLRIIHSATWFIGWHNLRKRHSLLVSAAIFLICAISYYLYMLNRSAGRWFSRVVFGLISFKNRLGHKKILKCIRRY
ncbi:MAG: B12-binding domain-containing radical SAM protein [Candidatus Omnitrophota bacterium]